MRVISGICKGMVLKAPKDKAVRPTTDMVKEAIFGVIQFKVPGSAVLDLFAGSGALGIEALSRGAALAVFVDNTHMPLIKGNLEKTKLSSYKTIDSDYLCAIKRLRQKFDIIFLDPPYDSGYYLPALDEIRKSGILNSDAVVVIEHPKEDVLAPEGYEIIKTKIYGAIAVTYAKEVQN